MSKVLDPVPIGLLPVKIKYNQAQYVIDYYVETETGNDFTYFEYRAEFEDTCYTLCTISRQNKTIIRITTYSSSKSFSINTANTY